MTHKETEKKLNEISPSMCIAKWKQSTINLYNGFTHSCHHPMVHKIPEELLEDNPSVIHNTPHKIEMRKEMLDGKRPDECDYCWNIEDNTSQPSDRILKSASAWGKDYFDEVQETLTPNPSYLEVAFETTCNLKCAYCGPAVSSKWMEEIKQLGPYPTSRHFNILDPTKTTIDRHNNPYVTAFWKWLPETYNDLHDLRVTGGEPLLSKDLWRLFDYFNDNPREGLDFSVNTNLDVPKKLIDKFINEINKTKTKVTVFTSAEATGEQCEYIRYGMKYDRFMANVDRILTETDAIVSFMCAVNVMSAPSLEMLLKEIIALKKKYGKDRITFALPYVRHPEFLDVRILPLDLKEKFAYSLYCVTDDILSSTENTQILRLQQFVMNSTKTDINRLQDDFRLFTEEYDKRRNVNFDEVFPELKGLIDASRRPSST